MFEKIKNFFREVKVELKKVVFPSREEVIGSTKVVVVLVLIIAVFLGMIDLILSKLIGMVIR
ncbi:MAG TPA: preprotein translocase subunit SecE [Nitrospiraceae bacterium]|nr:preprotein translocase subunit SecE [Nitrospiraceae bacterium]